MGMSQYASCVVGPEHLPPFCKSGMMVCARQRWGRDWLPRKSLGIESLRSLCGRQNFTNVVIGCYWRNWVSPSCLHLGRSGSMHLQELGLSLIACMGEDLGACAWSLLDQFLCNFTLCMFAIVNVTLGMTLCWSILKKPSNLGITLELTSTFFPC